MQGVVKETAVFKQRNIMDSGIKTRTHLPCSSLSEEYFNHHIPNKEQEKRIKCEFSKEFSGKI